MQGKDFSSRTCKGRLKFRTMLKSFITAVILVLVTLFYSSIRLSTVKTVSKIKSVVTDVLNRGLDVNHWLDEYVTNSTVFQTSGSFEPSPISYSATGFDEKQNARDKLEVSVPQTSMAPGKLEPIQLNVTAHIKLFTVDLNSKRAKTKSTELLRIESLKINKHSIAKDGLPINTNVRKNECDNCFNHYFDYVIQNEHICDTAENRGKIDLLICVTTIHKNAFIRQTLRRTWLSYTKNNTANVRHVFLLGQTANYRLQEFVMRENEIYHDIVQETFIDSYHNLTYKTIMGFKWASTKCPNAKFVMKTDDDVWVNVPSLMKLLSGSDMTKYLQTGLTGSCSQNEPPIRDKTSKWYASLISYPDKFYPDFCSGTGYVTSINVVSDIYHVSPHVPFFHLEDVYVGLCARKLGFSLKSNEGFRAERHKTYHCDYKMDHVLTVHQVTPSVLTVIWTKPCSKVAVQR
ncbi:beta-1,3-galactosyltransferase 1-like [Dreissena polymorpha]|uniref:Hexosyltransferase n=1 Tax=Dreissena polymorpha TaxID=45954 RepID=A0A9D4BEK3_DREPO|nr:beta-1,3-galactosyltransferase 1-like [Dreissena polymorpha]XP_052258836.1 beta-1,3-galactosyltransferase 1-like [Dreissena polymorpha]XP_052258837.1 beta-1,3-galactosyltransferase 1-like [Dreissena polymorpha]XP_052258839.1 beta-1,3-galactosyltransferase 1-like [Dreissena polymorpha]XP_052258840.1 beta-1,3-galactosyltransferase 1-like [Dreissena polymorpha]XP_052258841.1 beta-1,3-galactosyltransferase 1-like [Dreissena polymorpha]KAH3692421.1 hypothetical protein DPMN_194261 [Dreissena po